METERRRAERLKKTLYIHYRTDAAEGQAWDTGSVKDISGLGLSFVSNRPFLPNQFIQIRMRLPSSPADWMSIKAKIVSCADSNLSLYLTRVEFSDINQADQAAIKRYVSTVLKTGGLK